MCGIFAAVNIKEAFDKNDFHDFCGSCEVVAHRGPDDQSYNAYLREGSAWGENRDHFQLFLGHRRLAILGLERESNQPFTRDHVTLIFNGEIYNYLEIKERHLQEYTFTTNSDTEVLLRAYQKFGTECFRLFNGMWAVVIFDRKLNRIIVCRDRFSVKPLYHMRRGDTWYFASEIKQLTRLRNFSFSPHMPVMKAFLNQSLLDHVPATFFEGIEKFPAMHYMVIDLTSGYHETYAYWGFQQEEQDYADPGETFRSLLLDSLKLRLRSDVPVGTLLSGGLDSSAITVLTQKYLDQTITSFSVVSDEKKYSEENFVDILVNEKGVSNQKLRFNNTLALDHIEHVLDIQGEPYGSLSVVAQYLLFKKIKDDTGIKVLLSGQGADEILLGYNKFYFFYLRYLWKKKDLAGLFTNMAGSFFSGTSLWQLEFSQAKRYIPGFTNKGRPFFTTHLPNEGLWQCQNLNLRQISDITQYSIPALTHYEDRNSMAQSIEVRLPFLDYRLVDYLTGMPPSYKLKNGWTKHILRKTVPELPEAIRWRKDKQGFVTPEKSWMQNELGAFIVSEMERKSHLHDMGIIDKQKYAKAVKDFGKANCWLSHGDLFMVYITEKWLRKNLG